MTKESNRESWKQTPSSRKVNYIEDRTFELSRLAKKKKKKNEKESRKPRGLM